VAQTLRLPFALRGLAGHIQVSVSPNNDPDAIGSALLRDRETSNVIRGFPICRANIDYPAEGYAAVFGWTQMVRSTDQSEYFEMDPIAIYADIATPFAWFGVKPQAFDAPSRDSLYELSWEAHCFLCVSPDAVLTPHAQAITGFSWGFSADSNEIFIATPRPLGASAWDAHLELLRSSYPNWTFDPGYIRG
jgi:hypothetical protein